MKAPGDTKPLPRRHRRVDTGGGDRAAASLRVVVLLEGGDWTGFGDLEAVSSAAAAAVAAARPGGLTGPSEACIAFDGDARVRELNRSYRGQDKPTNVLSFPSAPRRGAGNHHLGDIVLAAETIAREARELALPPSHHLQHLVVHGLLHLLGYDHETDADARAMEALEVRILATLAISNPYAGDVPGA